MGQRISDDYIAVAAYIDDVRSDRLQSDFVKAWLHVFLVVFPLATALMLYLCDPVQLLLGDKTWQRLDDEHSHATVAALIQIGVIFTAFVFVVDWLAFAETVTGDYLSERNALFYMTTVTGVLIDFAAFGWVVYVLLKSIHWNIRNLWHRWNKEAQHINIKGGSERIKKLMSTILVAPILCLANHIHYIAIAFVSDPLHAGTVGIAYGLSVAFHYFIFRQFYNRVVLHTDTRKNRQAWKTAVQVRTPNSLRKEEGTDSSAKAPVVAGPSCKRRSIKRTPFNTQMVVVGLFCVGPLVLLYEGIVITLFATLPLSKTLEDVPTRLSAVTQGAGILIVLLLTYNIILNPNPFSFPKAVGRIGAQLRLNERVPSWGKLADEEKFAHCVTALLGKATELEQGYADTEYQVMETQENGSGEITTTEIRSEIQVGHTETPV